MPAPASSLLMAAGTIARRKPGRPRTVKTKDILRTRHTVTPKQVSSDSSGESFDFGGISEYDSDEVPQPERGGGTTAFRIPVAHDRTINPPFTTNERLPGPPSRLLAPPTDLLDRETESTTPHADELKGEKGQLSKAMSVLSISSSSAFAEEAIIELSD